MTFSLYYRVPLLFYFFIYLRLFHHFSKVNHFIFSFFSFFNFCYLYFLYFVYLFGFRNFLNLIFYQSFLTLRTFLICISFKKINHKQNNLIKIHNVLFLYFKDFFVFIVLNTQIFLYYLCLIHIDLFHLKENQNLFLLFHYILQLINIKNIY